MGPLYRQLSHESMQLYVYGVSVPLNITFNSVVPLCLIVTFRRTFGPGQEHVRPHVLHNHITFDFQLGWAECDSSRFLIVPVARSLGNCALTADHTVTSTTVGAKISRDQLSSPPT